MIKQDHIKVDAPNGKGRSARAGDLTSALVNQYRDLRDRSKILFLMDTRLRDEELQRLDLTSINFAEHGHSDVRGHTLNRASVILANPREHKDFVLSHRTVEAIKLYSAARLCMDDDMISLVNRSGHGLRPKLIWFALREWYDRWSVRLREIRGVVTRLLGASRNHNTTTRSTGSQRGDHGLS